MGLTIHPTTGTIWQTLTCRPTAAQQCITVRKHRIIQGEFSKLTRFTSMLMMETQEMKLWAHNPSSIRYHTNTGGNVTTWAINSSLPRVSPSARTTVPSTERRPNCGHKPPTWSGPTAEAQPCRYLNITVVDEVPTCPIHREFDTDQKQPKQ